MHSRLEPERERALIEEARTGRAGLRELYGRYLPRVYGYVAAMLLMALILVGFGRLAAERSSASATATPAAVGAEPDRLVLVSSVETPGGSTGNLTIVDRATGQETPARTFGGSPDAAISPDGGSIYVAATESSGGEYRDYLTAIDLKSGAQLWRSEIQNRVIYKGTGPSSLVLSADGQALYVYSYDPMRKSDGTVEYWLQRLDARTGKLDPQRTSLGDCGSATFQVASPSTLVAACSELSQLEFVDLAGGKVDTLDVRGAGWLAGAALSADRRLVYAVTTTWQLDVVDVATRAIVRTVALDQPDEQKLADAVALTRDGSRLVVSARPPQSANSTPAIALAEVRAYDTRSWQRTTRVLPDIAPLFQLVPSPNGHDVYLWGQTPDKPTSKPAPTVLYVDLDHGDVPWSLYLAGEGSAPFLDRVLAMPTAQTQKVVTPAPTPVPAETATSGVAATPAITAEVPTATPARAPAVQTPVSPADKPTPAPLVNPTGPRESRTVKVSIPSLPDVKSITAATFLDPSHGWLARDADLYSSVDGGRSWSKQSALPARVRSLDFVSASTGWAATDAGLYVTADGGSTWRSVTLPGGQGAVDKADFVDATHGWASAPSTEAHGQLLLLQTADGGRTWHTLTTPCDDRTWAAFSFVGFKSGWLVCGSQPGAGNQEKHLYHTDDAGSRWRLVSQSESYVVEPAVPKGLPGSGYVSDLHFLDNSHGWLASTRGGILSTADGGRTWKPIPSFYGERFPQTVRFVSREHGYVVDEAIGGRMVVLETGDAGLTWTQIYPELAPMQGSLRFVDARHGFGFGTSVDGGALLASDDGGATWRQVSTFGKAEESVQAFSFADSRSGWVLTQSVTDSEDRYTLYRTSDGGRTWSKQPVDPSHLMDFPLFLSFVDDQTGYVASSYGHLAVTHDGGNNFAAVDPPGSPISGLDFATQGVGWKVSDFQIYATHDGGRSWSPVPLGYRVFAIHLVSETTAWVEAGDCSLAAGTGCAQAILSTDDGGRTWTRLDFGSTQVSSLTFADDQHGWLATPDGMLLATSDGGRNWALVH